MAGGGDGGGGAGEGGEPAVIEQKDATKLLVMEHLVQPVPKRGGLQQDASPMSEKQEAVGGQQDDGASRAAVAQARRALAGCVPDAEKQEVMACQQAREVLPIVKNLASENQTVKVAEISGEIKVNINDQMYASLRSLQKLRDDVVREYNILGDRRAQLDMDVQTILKEGKMTPRVSSIIRKYEENSSNGEASQAIKIKKKRLTEAVLPRTKCQELDEICRENNWILPRYSVLPSLIDGLYEATVYLVCPDLELNADGGVSTTPSEARDSAAAAMLHQLHKKAKEKLAKLDSSTPDAVLLDKIHEKTGSKHAEP